MRGPSKKSTSFIRKETLPFQEAFEAKGDVKASGHFQNMEALDIPDDDCLGVGYGEHIENTRAREPVAAFASG